MILTLVFLLVTASAFAESPRRILSLCSTATDVILAIGGGDQLAGMDEYGRVVPGTAHIPVIAKGGTLSREEVISRRFDLAFLWWYQDEAARLLGELNVPVVRIPPARAAELPDTVRRIGQHAGHVLAANQLADRLSAFLQSQTHRPANPPRVYLELYGPYKTVGGDSYLNDLITLAGGTNVAAEIPGGSVVLSAEQLIAARPDVMLFVEGFDNRTHLPGLRRVGIHRQWLVAGSRLAQAVAALRAAIHERH